MIGCEIVSTFPESFSGSFLCFLPLHPGILNALFPANNNWLIVLFFYFELHILVE
jgi:hypothetical protein